MALLKRKRSGLGDPMSVVTRFVNACNRHDAEAVAQCLHAEFDSIQPMFPTRNFRGADQVRRNWQAIFDAEPGFRLTVLRQAAADDTVWLELHGAGRDAEVAGVFVMGIEGDRVRWARIYSGLVEPLPPGYEDAVAASSPAPLREVPPLDEPAEAVAEPVLEEDLIAPVVDIDGGGRSRRRRSRRRADEVVEGDSAAVESEAPVEGEAAVDGGDVEWAPPVPEGDGEVEAEEPVPLPVDETPADDGPATALIAPADSLATGPHPEVVVVPEDGDGEPAEPEIVEEATALPAEPEVVEEPLPVQEPVAVEVVGEDVVADVAVVEAPPAELGSEPEVVAPPAVEAAEPEAEPESEPHPEPERHGKWLGRKRR
jgi:limonene-1,2-epoxide hydrolase